MDNHLLIGLALIAVIIIAFLIDLKSRKIEQKSLPPLAKPTAKSTASITSEKQPTEPLEAAKTSIAAPVNETQSATETPEPAVVDETPAIEPEAPAESLFSRMVSGLNRTRGQLSQGLGQILLGKKEIDEDLLEEIETQLLMADIGVEACTQVINAITEKSERKELKDADAVYQALKTELANLLADKQAPLEIEKRDEPFVILVVGVNGVGKTTTIGKMAKRFQNQGLSVMLAAGDTFRAAAVEQLQVWGERNDVPVVAQHTGADSASVIFDAVESARSKNIDVIIADTAGRLQNKDNLMSELEKVVRVMKKVDNSAPHEVMLVLDAGTGQNALSQAQIFQQAVGVTGISLTKLDGTAKGGIIFAIAKQLGLPIRFIGVGEQIDDLRPFNADEFIEALFESEQEV
ncbi:signal recognition particle-docking protein FtsY [Oleiphilus sp. HI0071]|uniref:signal recognition particle-docking protein FtsY n=1 Tax=unclassified Oleiphilus TaxID=2631174 RepID=UPI0007C364FB|nr:MULTISPECIES: signal recognition particle-docking protein FtsY [unclassified Oleiphilus]KZY61390.1 signal recognition particle-docking protein FtsY [Oleiphilus sp. HI0065]KZY82326.1 signal recognition particle-docking protein FtsY [Oleiphilus sp. HI0071]KZZ01443.1 signal recognition particle-docking protein FtsY [Oleiphilus sp. HI0073]KZZ54892.1 signal recognition particle-docking protein FtsY [Oleiphilus sp. HI0118]KZZ57354.1 signal recognition particle-docking protein FtsY [Oleiphilus sp.